MNVLIAPDKFKGSLSAKEVCLAVEKGIKRYDATINSMKHPLADGGEGTLEILKNYFNLTTVIAQVKDPIFRTIFAKYMMSDTTAYIEMSNASGLQLLKKEHQNCSDTTTFGTGELILDAIDMGLKNIVLFIGGSATNDAGIGMASALGYEFYNSQNQLIKPIGKELINIDSIEKTKVKSKLKDINFKVVCDVKNPLYGENGAAYVYAKQKGASFNEIEQLDLGLQNFSVQVEKHLQKSVASIEGSGAAGGLGAGALSFLNAELISGIDFVMEQTKIENHFNNPVDLIITGEGSVDKQTLEGKVIKGIATLAEKTNTPFCIISGIVKDKKLIQENLKPLSIHAIMNLNIPQQESILNAAKHIENISYAILKEYNKKRLSEK
jgi:glycerate kinase